MKTEQELMEDELRQKLRHSATVAVAAGSIVKDAVTRASMGERAVLMGCAIGLFAFVLPWAGVFGVSASGFRLANELSGALWLHPLTMICCVGSQLLASQDPSNRILLSRWLIIAGTFWLSPAVVIITGMFSGAVLYGGYLALIGALTIIVGGTLQIREGLSAIAAGSPLVGIEEIKTND